MSLTVSVCVLWAACLCRRKGVTARMRRGWGLLPPVCMIVQCVCLVPDGLLSFQTALPLHLCSFSGLMTYPFLTGRIPGLDRFFKRFSVPGAALALLFPAVVATRWPFLTRLSFTLLHALIAFAPLLAPRAAERRPCVKASCSAWQTLSRRGGLAEGLGVFGLCLTLLTGALAANQLFGANYLFLRALPFPSPMWQTLSPSGRAGCYLLLSVPLSFAPLHFKRRHVV